LATKIIEFVVNLFRVPEPPWAWETRAILHPPRFAVQTLLMPEEKDASDLFDLKFLPSWLKEAPNENRYADFTGEEAEPVARARTGERERGRQRRDRHSRSPGSKVQERRASARGPERPRGGDGPREPRQAPAAPPQSLAINVRFVPDGRVLQSVLAQIKSGHVAYSVFSLARMFLDKPERYDVRLKAETGELFQLGETGPVSNDRSLLENGAFLNEKNRFYRTEVTQTEPIKGNFSSVARCRLSGTLLGPTNYHGYQMQLRNLYEQRFSRRMSFPDYQRQIEIVNDPETVERWKEDARSLTTYVTVQEEPPLTFKNATDTERHFRQAYLPGLLRNSSELTVDGAVSRRLSDRSLGRLIEDAWAQEFRSPAKMMQELSGAFRQGGLQIFRHRKGMLFVSPIRARPLSHETSSVSSSIQGILAALKETPGMNRKQLLDKLSPEGGDEPEARERTKRSLASDLHWLVNEGHVVEFNDGSLDLPRVKATPPTPPAANGTGSATEVPNETRMEAALPDAVAAEGSTAGTMEPPPRQAADAPVESATPESGAASTREAAQTDSIAPAAAEIPEDST
jgi:hypothetical protein